MKIYVSIVQYLYDSDITNVDTPNKERRTDGSHRAHD